MDLFVHGAFKITVRLRDFVGTIAIVDIAPYQEPGRFVSGDVDHSIMTWRFPGNLPRAGDPILKVPS